ncbi:MAG TPA: polymer-forming cytoskeletal protein, partial [Prolixibacteraceae bacterium]|nr:polymer-forming cytoskeletal protein [Prolixibacteraceae bacterium]
MANQTTKPYGEVQGQAINILSEGTTIKGDIVANGDIRIDGSLNGNIEAKGRLVVGPKGKVEGEINCNNIEVSGSIKGKINVSELLTMKASAQINGDIVAGKLSVEPGSVFTGTCTMGQEKSDLQKTSSVKPEEKSTLESSKEK